MNYSKELLHQTLQTILRALEAGKVGRHNSYNSLFPKPFMDVYVQSNNHADRYSYENALAVEAIKYPDLHPVMEKIVLKLTEIGERGNHTGIWENEEEQAGGSFARELAMYDKKYLPLHLRYIYTNDMDHEVYQTDDIINICNKWDYSPEVYPLLIYRAEFGQETEVFEELAKGILKKESEAQSYLDAAIGYFQDTWSFTQEDEEDIEQIKTFFTPVFGAFYKLDDTQMEAFATEFVNRLAEENEPSIADLLTAGEAV